MQENKPDEVAELLRHYNNDGNGGGGGGGGGGGVGTPRTELVCEATCAVRAGPERLQVMRFCSAETHAKLQQRDADTTST